jgi:bifunctional DNase/RNase
MLYQGICYLQPGKNDILSVDARPSDAINVANRCKVYIFHTLAKHLLQIDFAVNLGSAVQDG